MREPTTVSEKKPPPEVGPRQGVLIRLHEFVQAEMTRYRDVEWQVPSIMVAFLFGLASAIGADRIGSALRDSMILRVSFTLFVTTILLTALYFLRFAEKQLETMRKLNSRVEGGLGISTFVRQTLIPAGEASPSQKVKKSLVLAIPMAFITFLVWLIALWLIWLGK